MQIEHKTLENLYFKQVWERKILPFFVEVEAKPMELRIEGVKSKLGVFGGNGVR